MEPSSAARQPGVGGWNHVGITARDLGASNGFYRDLLGFELLGTEEYLG
jgi:catechol 2,3-dioxygenase-like lactoylglutathione lyase family enzyme